jgi:hypothetical protein
MDTSGEIDIGIQSKKDSVIRMLYLGFFNEFEWVTVARKELSAGNVPMCSISRFQ